MDSGCVCSLRSESNAKQKYFRSIDRDFLCKVCTDWVFLLELCNMHWLFVEELYRFQRFLFSFLCLFCFQLGELCVDPRPAVRKSAGQTLFSTIAAHGGLLQSETWQTVLWKVRKEGSMCQWRGCFFYVRVSVSACICVCVWWVEMVRCEEACYIVKHGRQCCAR